MIFLELFIAFFIIGVTTFGGGYAMIPQIIEVLTKKEWVLYEDCLKFISISESTPGVFAVNMATFTGFTQGSVLGAIIATLGLVIPSIIIITIIAVLFEKAKKSKIFGNIQKSVRPIAIGLLISIVITFAKTYYFPNGFESNFTFCWQIFVISIVCLIFRLCFKKASPIFLIIIGGVLGIILL